MTARRTLLTLLLALLSSALGAAAGFGGSGGSKAKAAVNLSSPLTESLVTEVRGGARAAAESDAAPVVKRALTPADLAIAGAIATMVGDAALHPIDCIKTLQQTGAGSSLGFFGAGKNILETQGLGGFYSGLGTYIVADGGAGAVKFATYEVIKKWVSDRVPEEYVGPALFGCAAAAYMASSVVLIPGELIKQRMQMGQASSFTSAVATIWKNDGVTGFFAGYQGVWLRDIPYTALELGIYDNVKTAFMKRRNNKQHQSESNGGGTATSGMSGQSEEILAGAIAGGITGYLTNPLDLIKTKLMVESDLYSGFLDAARQTYQSGGLGALFHGAGARVGYILPFCALYLPIYEVIKRRMETTPVKVKAPKIARGGGGATAALLKGKKKSQKSKSATTTIGRGGAQQVTATSAFVVGASTTSLRSHRLDGEDNFVSF